MTKPIVFNYSDYEKVVEENKKLKAEVANLLIRCRIAESDKPKWIPVEERLPTRTRVLCTGVWKEYNHREVFADDYDILGDGWGVSDGGEVIAWMPLPDPYKEEPEDGQKMIEFIAQVSEEDFKKITNGETIFQYCKLVRCKDCERYIPKHRRCEWTWLDRNPEDFCSKGERAVREDGEE